ncbi:MAG: PA2169 family four-helix-bundle protein [Bacteroidota bacterium]
MSISKAIDAFNSLIVINNDRIKGYRTASREIEEPELKQFFVDLSETSVTCRNELIDKVESLGGVVDEGTRTSGKFFRAWMEIKSALTGNDINTIVKLCEYGENVALDAYKDVLIQEVHEIVSTEQNLLNKQYALLKGDYEKLKLIRNVLKSEQ